MIKRIVIYLLFLSTYVSYAIDRKIIKQIKSDPIRAIESLISLPDSDDKFAALYRADSRIAVQTDMTYYYQDKINPLGFHNKEPGKFEKYVMKNRNFRLNTSIQFSIS